MSDTETQTHIIALRLRERDLELEAVAIRARTEEVRNMLELLENPRRPRGRPPRNASTANQNPMQGLQAHLNPHPSQSQDALQKAAPYPGQGHANPYPGQILELPDRVPGGMGEATPEPDSAA